MDTQNNNERPEDTVVSSPAGETHGEFLSDKVRTLTPTQMVVRRFFRSRLSVVGLAIIVALFLFSFVGPLIFTRWGETGMDKSGGATHVVSTQIDYTDENGESYKAFFVTKDTLEYNIYDTKPSLAHPLGTDDKSMDIFTRLMYGGQVSLTLSLIVVILETLLGILLGGLAGYFGGWVDMLIMRIVDILNCIPTLPLMLIISVMFDSRNIVGRQKLYFIMVFLCALGWTGVARVVRGQILSLREQEFMVATEACGLPTWRRIYKHLVPNVMPQLIVIMTLGLGSIILTEATLGYLGLGLDYPSASWGTMINSAAKTEVLENYWNMWIPASVCIVLAVLGFNFVGDGLRDALDPRMKR